MGAAIGGLLVGEGHDVLWLPAGRSVASARRAEAAGMRPVDQGQILDADVILSVCPPFAAVEVARRRRWLGRRACSSLLLLGAFALARSNSVDDALVGEWRRSQPGLEPRLRMAVDAAVAKGWRWVGEMQEIAATFTQAGLPPGFAEAAAEVFAASPRGQQSGLEELVSALLEQAR